MKNNIIIEINSTTAQPLANYLPSALKSSKHLSDFSGAMPFSLREYGIDIDDIDYCLSELNDLTKSKLPKPNHEEYTEGLEGN